MRTLLLSLVALSSVFFSTPVAMAGPCGEGVDCVADLSTAVQEMESGETTVAPAPAASHRPADTTGGRVYDRNQARIDQMQIKPSASQQRDLTKFYNNWVKNKARYEAVAAQTGVPAQLIAALHWRESTGNFNTYLHQGDRLGRPARHVPRNIPVFHEWEPAAVHALNMKKTIRDMLGMTADTTDLAALATYAEYYNGLGYYKRGTSSPYVFAGTNQYSRGKYVADGRYSSKHVDKQLGVMTMVQYIHQMDAAAAPPP